MSYPSLTYNFSDGQTSNATYVTQNFTDIVNGTSDGTKDWNIAGIHANAQSTLVAMTFPTNNTYDVGSETYQWKNVYVKGETKGSHGTFIFGSDFDNTAYPASSGNTKGDYVGVGGHIQYDVGDLGGIGPGEAYYHTMPKAGSIVSISVLIAITSDSGSGSMRAYVNDLQVGSTTLTTSDPGNYSASSTYARGVHTFSAGDSIGAKINWIRSVSSGSYSSVGHVTFIMEVVFDT